MNIHRKRTIYIVLIIVWMGCIFFFSSQNGEQSISLSSSILRKMMQIFYPKFNFLTTLQQTDILSSFSLLIRKTAHMSEYALLYLLVYQYVSTYIIKDIRFYELFPLITVFLYACSDEFHQLFIVGRSGCFIDVMIDTTGGFIMCICIIIIKYFVNKRKWKERYYGIL